MFNFITSYFTGMLIYLLYILIALIIIGIFVCVVSTIKCFEQMDIVKEELEERKISKSAAKRKLNSITRYGVIYIIVGVFLFIFGAYIVTEIFW